ncbi:MAG: sorbitol-6-phosphate dehydrogenase subunit [Bacilli bacterium]
MSEEKWLNLSNKIVVVTGGAMGIGEAIVKDLLGCGAKVIVFDIATPKFLKFDNLDYFDVDITNKKEIEKAVSIIIEKYGRIDALINDAAITRPRILVDYYMEEKKYELNEKDFDDMVNINQKGTFLVSQSVARYMVIKKSGTIINLSSCAGLNGSRGHSCYAATKAAIHSFTLSWAKELGPFNIRVVGVAPDIMDRTPANNDEKYKAQAYGRGKGLNVKAEDFFENYKSAIPLGRPGHLMEVANLISYLISDHASYITGITIPVSGGRTRN